MSTQKEKNLHDFPAEMRELRVKMEGLLPDHLAALRRVCQIPQEFKRRFWASRVEALVQKVKTDYKNYTLQATKASLLGKMAEVMANFALQATGHQPITPSAPLQTCISIYPSGRIEPALLGSSSRQEGAVLVTIEKFEAIARRLRGEIMKGKVVPQSEEEIPKLIHDIALKVGENLPEQLA